MIMITELRFLECDGEKVLQFKEYPSEGALWDKRDALWQDVPTVKEEPKTVTITKAELHRAYCLTELYSCSEESEQIFEALAGELGLD